MRKIASTSTFGDKRLSLNISSGAGNLDHTPEVHIIVQNSAGEYVEGGWFDAAQLIEALTEARDISAGMSLASVTPIEQAPSLRKCRCRDGHPAGRRRICEPHDGGDSA